MTDEKPKGRFAVAREQEPLPPSSAPISPPRGFLARLVRSLRRR